MARGFTPGATNREVMWFALAFAAGVTGLAFFAEPPASPFTGRGALLFELIYAHLGALAFPAVVCTAAAGALARIFHD